MLNDALNVLRQSRDHQYISGIPERRYSNVKQLSKYILLSKVNYRVKKRAMRVYPSMLNIFLSVLRQS